MDDVDRAPALIEAADPPEQGSETGDGWDELADRYRNLTGVEFIHLPAAERAAAVQARTRCGRCHRRDHEPGTWQGHQYQAGRPWLDDDPDIAHGSSAGRARSAS